MLERRFDGFGENSPKDRLQCVSVSVSLYFAYFHLTSPSIELIFAKSQLLMGLVTSAPAYSKMRKTASNLTYSSTPLIFYSA